MLSEVCSFSEQIPSTNIIDILPLWVQKRLKTINLCLTCIDVNEQFYVFGSNIGIIYLVDRIDHSLQKLKCDDTSNELTFVKILSSVDYMIAAGNKVGKINIFFVPKKPNENLPLVCKMQVLKRKKIKFFIDMHSSAITALAWSQNGIRLFSGDVNGVLNLTEIDFHMNICKTSEILKINHEVVQLFYHKDHLLISTTLKSFICYYDARWKIIPIGSKDLELEKKFGATFFIDPITKSFVIITARSAQKLWIADITGKVQKTIIFNDVKYDTNLKEIPILNPMSTEMHLSKEVDNSFGKLLQLSDRFLLVFNSTVLYILDMNNIQAVAKLSYLRKISSLVVFGNEIFILENSRTLVRISNDDNNRIDLINQFGSNSNESDAEEALSAFNVSNESKLMDESIRNKLKNFQEISKIDFQSEIVFERKNRQKSVKKS